MDAISVDQTIVYPSTVLDNTVGQPKVHTDDIAYVTTPFHTLNGMSPDKALSDILQRDGMQPSDQSAVIDGGGADGVGRYYHTKLCHRK